MCKTRGPGVDLKEGLEAAGSNWGGVATLWGVEKGTGLGARA